MVLKRISLDAVDEKIMKLFIQLNTDKDQYILELEGKPIAGIVQSELVREERLEKESLLSLFKEVCAETKDFPEEEFRNIMDEAYRLARKQPQITRCIEISNLNYK